MLLRLYVSLKDEFQCQMFVQPTLNSGSKSNENPGRKNPKIRVENKHEAEQVEEDKDFDYIPNDGTVEYNNYSGMWNVGRYYGHVLHAEMM